MLAAAGVAILLAACSTLGNEQEAQDLNPPAPVLHEACEPGSQDCLTPAAQRGLPRRDFPYRDPSWIPPHRY